MKIANFGNSFPSKFDCFNGKAIKQMTAQSAPADFPDLNYVVAASAPMTSTPHARGVGMM